MNPYTEAARAAAREQLQREAVMAAQQLVDMWPAILDGLDGMVRQTMERGFTEREARAIIAASMTGRS